MGDPMNEERIREYRKQQAMLRRKQEKIEKRGKRFKALFLIIIFVLVFVFYENGLNFNFKFNINFDFLKKSKKGGEDTVEKEKKTPTSALKGKFIAYVPMDDRSVHTSRIIYLAESAGYELKMPDMKAYKTYLETGNNSYAGYNTTYGNPSKIAVWLLDMENAGCDYYLLSLDQLFSGGIVGSQYLSDDDFKMYDRGVDSAQRALAKIMGDKKNHVYLMDSIMGLSVTPGFQDFTANDYNLLVDYSSKERKNVDALEIDKIAENYILDPNGNSYSTDLNLEKLNRYLAARERKLTYSQYIIDSIGKVKKQDNIYLYYGIDGMGNGIQKNDVSFVKSIMKGTKNSIPVRDGLSSVSEEMFTKMLLDAIDQDISVNVRYYGDSNQKISNSNSTYTGFMNELMTDLGLKMDKNANIDVLVYTKNEVPTRDDSAKKLLNQYLSNIKNHVPTIIINDASSDDFALTRYLIDYKSTSIPMGYVIGYSSWGGFVHSSRIALSQGITRYLYLTQKSKNESSDKGFLKSLSFGYFEDIAYNQSSKDSTDLRVIQSKMDATTKKIRENMQSSNYISNLTTYKEKSITSIDVYNFKFPWGRPDEIDFDVSAVTDTKTHKVKIPNEVKLATDTSSDGQ